MRRWIALLVVGCAAAACTGGAEPASVSRTAPATGEPAAERLLVLGDDGNLVVVGPTGEDPLALTTDAGPSLLVRQPVASPNGRSIAWTEIERTGASVVTVSRFGEHRVETPVGIAPFYLQWDPTSSRLVYLGNLGASIGLGVVDQAVVQPDDVPIGGGAPLYLSWAPNGEELLIHVGTDGLGTTDLQHGLEPVGMSPGTFQAPVWLPDGRHVYATTDGNTQRLVVADDGSRRTLVTFRGGILFEASPDGRRIAYRLDDPDGSQRGIFVRTLTGGGRPELVTSAETTAFFWRPDGGALLLLQPTDPATSIGHRWVVWDGRERAASGSFLPSETFFREYLPFFDQYAQALTPWSPDGTAFAFAGTIDGREGIWVQRAGGGDPRFVTSGRVVSWIPAER